MLRATSLKLIFFTVVALGAIFLFWQARENRVYTLLTPEYGLAPISAPAYETRATQVKTQSKLRIGNFEKPVRVPEYEVIEEKIVDAEDARALRLLVDTRSRGEDDYTFISRDIKAVYADYDAVSVEFTDTEDLLDYKGGALIFNTPRGATYMGFIYGPPNTKGYYVRAVD